MAQHITATTLVHLMLYIMTTVLLMRLLIHSVVIAHTTMLYNAPEGNAVSGNMFITLQYTCIPFTGCTTQVLSEMALAIFLHL